MDSEQHSGTSVLPSAIRARFDAYPNHGLSLEPQLKANGKGSRKGYGLKLYQATGQNEEFATCIYCGLSFIDDPAHWYLISVDHIVPRNKEIKKRLGLDNSYLNAMANQALCCQACNTYGNRNNLSGMNYPHPTIWTPEAFFAFRDQVFLYRSLIIENRRKSELKEYYLNEWGGKGYECE